MKITLVEMEGLLRGKCVPAKMLVNETLAAFLVRQVDALHEKLEAAERECEEAELLRLEASEGLSIATRRYEVAEAELARLKAAPGGDHDA